MVVDEFDNFCTSISPDEAETPLRVRADAVLSAPVTDELLQTVSWQDPEVLDILRRMNQLGLLQGRPLHRPVKTLDVLLMPGALGVLAAERSDHMVSI